MSRPRPVIGEPCRPRPVIGEPCRPRPCSLIAALALGWACAACASTGAGGEGELPDTGDPGAASASDAGDAGADSYRRVRELIDRSCAYQRCHSGVPTGAGLSMAEGADHAIVLVGVPACEYERMARVQPGDPDNSWLMLKLTSDVRPAADPYADYILFEPDPDWDPSLRGCPDTSDAGAPLFGQRMPLTAPNMLEAGELETIRSWIAAGAPH